jgi:hypothetical protein
MLVGAGCYRYVPFEHPGPSTPVSAALTDRGSVELSEAIGPSAVRIDGRLISITDTTLSLAVSKVRFRNGNANVWSGEAVTVPRTYIATLQERQFSGGRTTVLSTVVLGAVVALVTAIDLVVFGDQGPEEPPPPSPSD